MDRKIGQSPFITLIMPVYRAEKYIRAAIDCVLAQTFQDFELLLVDDCSPDTSSSICDEYVLNYPEKIRVIHLEANGGAGNARNIGIENAVGEYIGFMDSDDTIDRDLLEKVAAPLRQYAPDAVVFGLTEEYYDANGALKYTQSVAPEKDGFLADSTALRKEIIHLEERTLYGYIWNKLYRLEKIRQEHIRFPDMKLHEDSLFNIAYFTDAQSLYLMTDKPYHYQKRIENSITSQFIPEYYVLHIAKIQKIYDQYCYWGLCTPEVKRILGNLYVRYTLSALQRNCDPRADMRHKNRKAWLKEQYASSIYETLIEACAPDNRLLKIFAFLFRKKYVGSALFCGRMVYLVKNKMPILFAKLKQKN